jgi:hypothetical protein
MYVRYVFIDETGDLGQKGSHYFVITAVWIDRPELLDRLIKNIRRHKFRKQLSEVAELKANKSKSELRSYIIEQLNLIGGLRGHAIILDKSRLYSSFLKNDKNKLYNYVCGVLASTMTIDSKKLIIRIDKSKGKQALRDDFDKYVTDKLHETRWNREVEIYHSWSQSWSGLQLADFVSWAVFQKYEHDDDSYFKIIEKKININYVWE